MKKIKGKLLAAAIALLGLSTAGAVTGTVAWFTASNMVSVSGMAIKAEAENGIVISNEAKATWAESATASHTGGTNGFIPTSTENAATWYHANSDNADDYTQAGGYKSYTTSSGITESTGSSGTGLGVINDPVGNIYLINHFYITSSTVNPITASGKTQQIYLKSIEATAPATQNSAELNKSLRVLVKSGAGSFIIAPIDGADTTYNVGGSATAASVITTVTSGDTSKTLWSGSEVPAYGADSPIDISVYCYFEGEDEHCKSTNIKATMDSIAVQASFGHTSV